MVVNRIAGAVAISFCLAGCQSSLGGLSKAKHERGLTLAYDSGYWEIAQLSDGFVLKEKSAFRGPRAATLTLGSGSALAQNIQSEQAASGGQLHSMSAGKPCPQGVILLSASYFSEKAADFSPELKLLQQASCPE